MSLDRAASNETLTDGTGHSNGKTSSPKTRKHSFDASLQGSTSPALTSPAPARPGSLDSRDPQPRSSIPSQEPLSLLVVPSWQRILQIAAAVTYCFFAGGIVFGYAALKPVLRDEGAYQEECDGDETCVEIHLNLMFTVAAVCTNVAALPVGAVLDNYGPRVCGIIGSFFLFLGAIFMIWTTSLPFDGLLFGYLLLALGGPFAFISSFHLSNAFPRRSGLVLALLTGAFDASSAVFLLYRLVYVGTDGAFVHSRFFTVYLAVPIFIFVLQLTLMPAQSYKALGELVRSVDEVPTATDTPNRSAGGTHEPQDDQIDEASALLGNGECQDLAPADAESLPKSLQDSKQLRAEVQKNAVSGVWGVMHNRTVIDQLTSWWFILLCAFAVVQMTRINFFVATVRAQYTAILDDQDAAARIGDFFDVALPLGGLVSVPFIGLALDHGSTALILAALVSSATLIGMLGVLPFTWAAYANVCLFVVYRPFYYTAVSDYSAKVFGFRTFGTVYGLLNCISGLFNFAQSGLDILFHRTFHENPVPVDLMLLIIGLATGSCLVGYVRFQTRNLRHRQMTESS